MEIVWAIVTFLGGGILGWVLVFLSGFFAQEDYPVACVVSFVMAFVSWIGIGIVWTGSLVVAFFERIAS